MGDHPNRRRFLTRAGAFLGAVFSGRLWTRLTGRSRAAHAATHPAGRSGEPGAGRAALTHGPVLGHVTPDEARVWARCSTPGVHTLTLRGASTSRTAVATASPDDDLCVVWRLTGLRAEERYRYEIAQGEQIVFADERAAFATPPPYEAQQVTRLAVGSCAYEDEGSASVWRRMTTLDPDVVVLLGDTPYIDSTDLQVQRTRHGEFHAVPEFEALVRNRPLYATWDDHDFGENDTDGRLAGKENSRQVFIEYHANPSYGESDEGIYTKFRMGGVEIFLLDTRYFAGTEPSPIAPDRPTLLGRRQWDWLQAALSASTAPFKLLASGIIWNGAVRPGKPDHWDTYPHEREALFRFLGDERISGVVLTSGDIHRTRVLRYDTTQLVGYPLTELVTSPIHDSVIEAANAPHPDLIHDSGEPHSFLLLTVDTTVSPPTLRAEFQNAAGRELYALSLDTDTLTG